MNIAQFREQHPEYDDMNDMDLTVALHNKHYQDMPFAEFAEKFGGQPAAQGSRALSVAPEPAADPSDVPFARYRSQGERVYDSVRNKLNAGPSGIAPMIGGTVGGMVGPLTLGQIPPLTALPEELVTVPLTAAIGSYLGGAGTRAAQQKLMTPSGVVDWRDVNKTGLWEAGSEVGGRAAIGGLKALGSLLPIPSFRQPSAGPARTVTGTASAGPNAQKVFQETMETMEKRGGVATPAQMDKRWWLHVGEGLARGSWVGSEAFEEAVSRNEAILVEMAKESVDDLADNTIRLSQTETGEKLYRAIARQLPEGGKGSKIAQWQALFDPIYAQVDDLAKGGVVSTSGLKKQAAATLKRDAAARGRLLESTTRQDYQAILKMDDDVSLQTMRDLRTRWQGKVRQFSKDMNPDMARVSQLSSLADDAIMNAQRSPKLPPDARKLLKTANTHYARYKRVMEDVFPLRMAEKLRTQPEVVVKELFPVPNRQTGGALTKITAVQNALTKTPTGAIDPEGQVLFDELRQAWLSGLIKQNTEKGAINTNMLRAQIGRYGKESLDILLPASQRGKLENVLNAADAIRRKGLMSGGALVAKSAQAGGGYMLYDGAREGNFVKMTAGGAFVFGPIAFAKLATHPLGSKILRSGLPQIKGHRQAATVGARLVRILMAEEKKEEKASSRLKRRYERQMQPSRVSGPVTYPERPIGSRHF